MIVGFDFDNTIVNYDNVFFKIALKKKFISKNISKNKSAIKEHFFKRGKIKNWKILQSEVYGKQIFQAKPYKGFLKILKKLLYKKIEVKIISHKTLHPYYGEKINLHDLSKKWIKKNIKIELRKKIKVYFEKTEKKKIQRIKKAKCDFFVDDLESILKQLPSKTKKILFSPKKKSAKSNAKFIIIGSWHELSRIFF
jgi:hypothetical protein